MGVGDVLALVIEQCLALCTARCSPCLGGPSGTVGKQSLDTRVLATQAQDCVHAVPCSHPEQVEHHCSTDHRSDKGLLAVQGTARILLSQSLHSSVQTP